MNQSETVLPLPDLLAGMLIVNNRVIWLDEETKDKVELFRSGTEMDLTDLPVAHQHLSLGHNQECPTELYSYGK